MKIFKNTQEFVSNFCKDIKTCACKDPVLEKGRLIASIAFRVLGVLGLTLAASILISGLVIAATPLAVASLIIANTLIAALSYDILIVGINEGSLHRDAENLTSGNLKSGFKGAFDIGIKIFNESYSGVPQILQGTLILKEIYKIINDQNYP